jgi:murein DD-endopeptidase MepM/ murein hydrolase activator NlpD
MLKRFLLCSVLLAAVATPALGTNPFERKEAVDAELGRLRDKIAAIRTREESLQADIEAVTANIRSLEREIGDISTALAPLERDLALHRQRLEDLNELLRLQKARLLFLRRQYTTAVERLSRRLVSLYESDDPGTLGILLAAHSLSEALDRLEFRRLVVEQDARIAYEVEEAKDEAVSALASTRRTRARVAGITRAIAYRTAQVRAARDELLSREHELSEARTAKRSDLVSLAEQEREWVSEADALEQASAELATKIRAASSATAPVSRAASADGLIWPVQAPITSPYGMRWGRLHAGVDLGAADGTPIQAAASGTVIYAGWLGGYGNLVVIEHGGGLATAYAHQSRVAVGGGQQVAQGQVVGYVGNTGHSFGPHLHFEVRVKGAAVDPLGYL